jgi:hypothetical protein
LPANASNAAEVFIVWLRLIVGAHYTTCASLASWNDFANDAEAITASD